MMSQARFAHAPRPPGFGQGVEAFLCGIHFLSRRRLSGYTTWFRPSWFWCWPAVLVGLASGGWTSNRRSARAIHRLLVCGGRLALGGCLAPVFPVILAQPLSDFALEVLAQERALAFRINSCHFVDD
jgi:hypothetical protein